MYVHWCNTNSDRKQRQSKVVILMRTMSEGWGGGGGSCHCLELSSTLAKVTACQYHCVRCFFVHWVVNNVASAGISKTKSRTCVINQAWGQDGCILTKFFFYMFMDLDSISISKHTRKEQDQYPAILTIQAWSIKDLLCGKEHYFLAWQSEKSWAAKIAWSCPLG